MKLYKQICNAFNDKKIDKTDPLEEHFSIIHDFLRKQSLSYGKRMSPLDEEDLKDVYQETSEYVLKQFQKEHIDIKKISIENSEPVIQKYVAIFIFIFQRRMINMIKVRSKCIELVEDMLEDFERKGVEELDMEEINRIQDKVRTIVQTLNFTETEKLFLEFSISKVHDSVIKIKNKEFISFYADKSGKTISPGRVSQIKTQLKKKLEANQKALEQIMMI